MYGVDLIPPNVPRRLRAPEDISPNGWCCGTLDDDLSEGWRWSAGGTLVGVGILPNFDRSWPRGVNSQGQVVGFCRQAFRRPGSPWQEFPFFWDELGGIQQLPLPVGVNYGWASAINDNGEIAGQISLPNNTMQVVLWSGAGMAVLATGAGWHAAHDVNNASPSTVVGMVQSGGTGHPCAWIGGTQHLIPLLPGTTGGDALAVNDAGTVVGYCMSAAGYVPFSWTLAGGTVALGFPPGVTSGYAVDINTAGDVLMRISTGSNHAAVLSGGAWSIVDTNIDPAAVGHVSIPIGMDDQGRILVWWDLMSPTSWGEGALLVPSFVPKININDTLAVIKILFGVINDGGGLGLTPGGHPVPIGPWDPFIEAVRHESRDAIIALGIYEAASLLGDAHIRGEIAQSVSKVLVNAGHQIGASQASLGQKEATSARRTLADALSRPPKSGLTTAGRSRSEVEG